MAVPKKRTEEWFICPLDQFTSQSLAEVLSRSMDVEEAFIEDMFFYRAPSYSFIQRFIDSARRGEYRFEIWRRRTVGSKLEKWPFTKPSRIKKTKKYKKAKKDLAKISH